MLNKTIIVLLCLISLLLTSCYNPEYTTIIPKPEPAEEEIKETTPAPIPSLTPTPTPLSYEEFFSVERIFDVKNAPYFDVRYDEMAEYYEIDLAQVVGEIESANVSRDVIFFSTDAAIIYRFYIPTKTLEEFHSSEAFTSAVNYAHSLGTVSDFGVTSTTDISWNDQQKSYESYLAGEDDEYHVYYSDLTGKEYRENSWYFHFLYLQEISAEYPKIGEVTEQEYEVVLEEINLKYAKLTAGIYLKERSEDLTLMGLNPDECSTFLFSDDAKSIDQWITENGAIKENLMIDLGDR